MNNIEKSLRISTSTAVIATIIAGCAKAPESVNIAESPAPITSPTIPSSCPTTEEAQELFGTSVQRIDTEECGWVWRGRPLSHLAVCPQEYVCTWDVKDDVTVVHYGIGQSAEIYAGTWRLASAYPQEDAVNDICKLYRKEKDFGAKEIPPFEVRYQGVPGLEPQNCPEK